MKKKQGILHRLLLTTKRKLWFTIKEKVYDKYAFICLQTHTHTHTYIHDYIQDMNYSYDIIKLLKKL